MSRLRFCELGVGGKIQLAIYVNNASFLEETVLQDQGWMQGDQLEGCSMVQA